MAERIQKEKTTTSTETEVSQKVPKNIEKDGEALKAEMDDLLDRYLY